MSVINLITSFSDLTRVVIQGNEEDVGSRDHTPHTKQLGSS